MRIFHGNMFEECKNGDALCVTTNGIVKSDGRLVMGKGVAKVFRDRFENIDKLLGFFVGLCGNKVANVGKFNIDDSRIVYVFSFPTKHNWRDKSDIELIKTSCIQLKEWIKALDITGNIYIPAPGCSNGGLNWETEVKPVVEKLLPEERYIICFLN